jgi:hypothetical protein
VTRRRRASSPGWTRGSAPCAWGASAACTSRVRGTRDMRFLVDGVHISTWRVRLSSVWCPTSDEKVANRKHGRQKTALERGTNPTRSRRTYSPRYGLHNRVRGNRRAARNGGVSSSPTRNPTRYDSQPFIAVRCGGCPGIPVEPKRQYVPTSIGGHQLHLSVRQARWRFPRGWRRRRGGRGVV